MSTDDPIEKQLSGINLENYRRRCREHPWYRESQALTVEWNKKVQACKDAGIDPATLFGDSLDVPVDEAIGYAMAAHAQPDVWVYYVEQVEKLRQDEEAEASPEYFEVIRTFEAWYFLHRGKPFYFGLLAGHALIQKFIKGELPSLDGPEARDFALSLSGIRE